MVGPPCLVSQCAKLQVAGWTWAVLTRVYMESCISLSPQSGNFWIHPRTRLWEATVSHPLNQEDQTAHSSLPPPAMLVPEHRNPISYSSATTPDRKPSAEHSYGITCTQRTSSAERRYLLRGGSPESCRSCSSSPPFGLSCPVLGQTLRLNTRTP
jgi:hypothetical protein